MHKEYEIIKVRILSFIDNTLNHKINGLILNSGSILKYTKLIYIVILLFANYSSSQLLRTIYSENE